MGGDNDHSHFEGLLGAYVLWALSPEERVELERHLRECQECRNEVARLRRSRDVLPLTSTHREPPPRLRDNLRQAVREDPLRVPGKAAYDAIVVGARCAGSPTAMLLARRGYRVLLVDRATFPSDTLSTHLLHAAGASRLRQWGLLNQIEASGCPPIKSMSLSMPGMSFSGSPPPIDGVDANYAPRRMVLDTVLVQAAADAGAEVRESFPIQELIIDDNRVIGVRGMSRNGGSVPEYARIVIGADGRRSRVAREVDAPVYRSQPARTACYYAYWSAAPIDDLEIYAQEGRAAIAFPTNDEQTVVLVDWPREEFQDFYADITGNYRATIESFPELAERVLSGRRESKVMGTADLPNFFRRPYGPGWALVGDAGYHKDPITLQGMTDAFRDAELLADAIDHAYSGRQPLDLALMRYEMSRNEAVMPMFSLTQAMASLRLPRPETRQMMEALQDDQEQADRFFGTLTGSVSMNEFYSPENLARIISTARP